MSDTKGHVGEQRVRTTSLHLLDHVRVASPCPMRWDDMAHVPSAGGDRIRHCGQCNLNVYNLSNMTRDEAEAIVATKEPGRRLCAGFYQRADGTILTRDCPAGLRAVRLRLVRIGSRIAAAIAVLLTGAVFARSRDPQRGWSPGGLASIQPFSTLCNWVRGHAAPPPVQFVAGDICIPVPPAPTPPAPAPGGN